MQSLRPAWTRKLRCYSTNEGGKQCGTILTKNQNAFGNSTSPTELQKCLQKFNDQNTKFKEGFKYKKETCILLKLFLSYHLFMLWLLTNAKTTRKVNNPNTLQNMQSNSQETKFFFVGVKSLTILTIFLKEQVYKNKQNNKKTSVKQ